MNTLRIPTPVAWLLLVALDLALVESCDLFARDYTARVVSIHDGDTLTVRLDTTTIRLRSGRYIQSAARNQIVRLADGVDCPETESTRWPAQPYSDKAKAFTESFTKSRTLHLHGMGADRGRMLARVTLIDGRDLGKELVARGLAELDPRYAKRAELFEAQEEARKDRKGVWSQDETEHKTPKQWREEGGG